MAGVLLKLLMLPQASLPRVLPALPRPLKRPICKERGGGAYLMLLTVFSTILATFAGSGA